MNRLAVEWALLRRKGWITVAFVAMLIMLDATWDGPSCDAWSNR